MNLAVVFVLTYANNPCWSSSCIQYVETWLNNTVILPILFYHVNSAVTGLLSQQLCNSLWYFMRVIMLILYSYLVPGPPATFGFDDVYGNEVHLYWETPCEPNGRLGDYKLTVSAVTWQQCDSLQSSRSCQAYQVQVWTCRHYFQRWRNCENLGNYDSGKPRYVSSENSDNRVVPTFVQANDNTVTSYAIFR